MKKLLLLAFATCFAFAIASAQNPGYFLNYGTTDGSDLAVTLDSDIDVPIWYIGPAIGSGDEDQDTNGVVDSVNFMHIPLGSDDVYITSRDGGLIIPELSFGGAWQWDDVSFLVPDPGQPSAGYTSQSLLAFAQTAGPDPVQLLFTDGAQMLLSTYYMHTVGGDSLIDSTRCPFVAGHNSANGDLLFGIQGGAFPIIPAEVFSCIYFTPNNDPVWGPAPTIPACIDAGIEYCFDLSGTDVDVLDDLHITQTSGPGTFTETAGGPGGVAAGTWCGTLMAGPYDLEFELNDGTVALPMSVHLEVNDIELEITCPAAFPGADVFVPVYLHTCQFLTGGFEILLGWDPVALDLLEITPAARINYGEEYFNVTLDDGCEVCPPGGSARIVWIADLNNGIDTPPAAAGDEVIFWLHFPVDNGVPFGYVTNIEFVVEHYSDNTISDETGYIFFHPLLTNGCVNVFDPSTFKGDPNMNGWYYEVADAVLVARFLIEGPIVWTENGTADDAIQAAAADVNNNGFVDVGDLVIFINVLNGTILPPKLDPTSEVAAFTMPNVVGDEMTVAVRSALDLGGAVISIDHTGIELGEPVASGMDVLSHDADGVLSLVVYSLEGNRIAAGKTNLVTIPVLSNNGGTMEFGEVSAADSYGRLLQTNASLVAPLPTEFAVKGNYPNPFNARTLINFDLPVDSDVNVNIYSITGQLVQKISGHFEAGSRSVSWDASDVASGVYFYKVSAGDFSQTMKMTLLK